jgi:hypothetical protein
LALNFESKIGLSSLKLSDYPNYILDNPYPHAICYIISYTVSGAALQNRISLSDGLFKIVYGYLKTD